MKKSRLEMMKEEVELARQGKITYEPDPPYVIIRDPKGFAKRHKEFCKMNGLPYKPIDLNALEMEPENTVELKVHVSQATYTRLTKEAKRENLDVTRYVEKMVEG